MHPFRTAVLTATMALVVSCAPRSTSPADSVRPGSAPPSGRTLTMSIPLEPTYLGALVPLPPGGASDYYQRMFNAFLEYYDDKPQPHPYLAESLPVLNTESWVVLPDGRMETRYRLKPNLVWHDGAPLTADDFVFAFQVAKPANGFRTSVAPYILMEDVLASDDRTFTIRWKSIYPDAGVLVLDTRFGLVPIPRHIVEPAFNQSLEAFQNHPYWSHEFVGAGPYKLDRWVLGSHLEASAFDQHVLGRPKIDRIRVQFITDPNTAFANLLAGTTDVAMDTLTFDHMLQLKREWGTTNRGTAGVSVSSFTTISIQHRPDYANPRAVLDPRVRKALAHGIDRHTFVETVWAGELYLLDTIFHPKEEFYPAIDRAITKYPYDPRASQRLMAEAGYTRGPDGFFAGPEGKLTFVLQGTATRREPAPLSANWRQAGFDIQEQPLAISEDRDPAVRASFPALYVRASGLSEQQQMARYRASEVSNPETRWRGENVTGWRNLAFDQLVDAFNVTLDSEERVQQRVQMAKLLSDELPAIMLTENPNMHAFVSTIQPVTARPPYRTTGRITWNIHQWEFASP